MRAGKIATALVVWSVVLLASVWFQNEMSEAITPFLMFIPVHLLRIASLLMGISCLIFGIKRWKKWKYRSLWPLATWLAVVILCTCAPLSMLKVRVEHALYASARLQAVQAIEQGDLEPDKLGSVSLADYGRHLSVDGTANVRSGESGNLIVTFWVFRGPLVIPYTAVIYTSKGVPLTNADLFPEEILEQYALDPNWYFVTAK